MDVFLSLYVLGNDRGENALLPFLIAAEDEDHAVDISDTFVETVEKLGSRTSTRRDRDDAREELAAMRAHVCLMEDQHEINLVMTNLRAASPNFEQDVQSYAGGLFTVGVNEEAGFDPESAKVLRNRMCGHRLINVLSVEIPA